MHRGAITHPALATHARQSPVACPTSLAGGRAPHEHLATFFAWIRARHDPRHGRRCTVAVTPPSRKRRVKHAQECANTRRPPPKTHPTGPRGAPLHCRTLISPCHFTATGCPRGSTPPSRCDCSANLMPFPPRSQSKSPRTRPSTWHQQCISTAQLLCSCIFLAGDGQSAGPRTVPGAS